MHADRLKGPPLKVRGFPGVDGFQQSLRFVILRIRGRNGEENLSGLCDMAILDVGCREKILRGTSWVDAQTGSKRADRARNISGQVVEAAGADLLLRVVGIGFGARSK